ncbi:ATP-binding protein [Shewanella sp.]|uniref:ATP-binding protein n=1 Tax=Shewanella sp. TaxID=50422 RepID=UPI0040541790
MTNNAIKTWLAESIFSRSLKARLIVSALLFVLLLLPVIGFALNDAFKEQMLASAKEELSAYMYSVLAITEVEQGQVLLPEVLLENRFNLINSGLYALISAPSNDDKLDQLLLRHKQHIVWSSASFQGQEKPYRLPKPAMGQMDFAEIQINNKPHLIFSFSANFASHAAISGSASEAESSSPEANSSSANPTSNFPVTIHIIKDKRALLIQINAFTSKLWNWLWVILVVLLGLQLSWLLWTLKPLARFTDELNRVEQGQGTQLSQDYPQELNVVAKQLNGLLRNEQNQRQRYRNALADLAHSLKTPLAIIQTQQGLSPSSQEQVANINRIISYQLRRAQSAAGSAWHLGVQAEKVTSKLCRTLNKIYPHIDIHCHVDQQVIFRGDEGDLTEMLGNVLDNACKAAKHQLRLTVLSTGDQVIIHVEDDGKGISQEKQQGIFERGVRADTYAQGHGIGLAISLDLVTSYQGQLSITESAHLGGAKFSFIFPN